MTRQGAKVVTLKKGMMGTVNGGGEFKVDE